MRVVWQPDDGDRVEWSAVMPSEAEQRLSDMAALQRETRLKLSAILEMFELEFLAMQAMVFFTFRANGRMISYARAGELLDEVTFEPDPGDLPGDEQARDEVDPTSGPEGSAPADDPDAVGVSPT